MQVRLLPSPLINENKMNKAYLLTSQDLWRQRKPELKGILIKSNGAASEDYGNLYKEWEKSLNIEDSKSVWTRCTALWSGQISPEGLFYTYDLTTSGGLYELWNLRSTESEVEKSTKWIRRSFDVVSLNVRNVELIEWVPPKPFEVIQLTELLNNHGDTCQ